VWQERHVDIVDTQRTECIHHRVGDCGRRSNGARFTDTLHAQVVAGGRKLGEFGIDVTEVVRSGQAMVHQAAAQHLAALVVHDILEHGLPDALRNAAQNLPFADRRIECPTDVVDDGVASDSDTPGLRVDLLRLLISSLSIPIFTAPLSIRRSMRKFPSARQGPR
jgi:hypothetical protein